MDFDLLIKPHKYFHSKKYCLVNKCYKTHCINHISFCFDFICYDCYFNSLDFTDIINLHQLNSFFMLISMGVIIKVVMKLNSDRVFCFF